MIQTLEKLNLNPEQYRDGLFAVYFEWCQSLCIHPRELQAIVANAAIARWYCYELAKCEAEFHARTNRYNGSPGISQDDYHVCYSDCLQNLFNIRPMALLKDIKRKSSASTGSAVGSGKNERTHIFNQPINLN